MLFACTYTINSTNIQIEMLSGLELGPPAAPVRATAAAAKPKKKKGKKKK